VKKEYWSRGDTTLTYRKRKGATARPRQETLDMIEKERQKVLKAEIKTNYLSNSEDKRNFKEVVQEIITEDNEGWTTIKRRTRGKGKELKERKNFRKNTIGKHDKHLG
jgi:hypothetical protein